MKASPDPEDRLESMLSRGVGSVLPYSGPGTALMMVYLPAAVGLFIVLSYLGVPIGPVLISIVGLAVGLTLVAFWLNRKRP
jgi:hypothetical protein